VEVHNPDNLPTAPIADLLPSQGNLKDLSDKNFAKLKSNIENRGFLIPVYTWVDKDGLRYLLDGHQRQRVLTTEGWTEPIPYLTITAETRQQAMAILLEVTSQYGTITQEGLDEYIATYELNEAEMYKATSFDAITEYTPIEKEIALPEGGDPSFQQMTFTLADEQAGNVKEAIKKALTEGCESEANQNRNGNALAMICEVYLGH